MARYRYNTQMQPPAPLVLVSLGNGDDPQTMTDQPGLADTGADMSAIPQELADALQLPQYDLQRIEGFGGETLELPTYLVQLAIRGLPAIAVEVVARPGLRGIIVGRDVLNRYLITLDGPNLTLEIQ